MQSLNVNQRKRQLERIATENAMLIGRLKDSERHGTLMPSKDSRKTSSTTRLSPMGKRIGGGVGAATMPATSALLPLSSPPNQPTVKVSEDGSGEEGSVHIPEDAAPSPHAASGALAKAATVSNKATGPASKLHVGAATLSKAPASGVGTGPSAGKGGLFSSITRPSLRVYQQSTMHDLAAVYAQYERSYLRPPHPSPELGTSAIALLQDAQYARTGVVSKADPHQVSTSTFAASLAASYRDHKPMAAFTQTGSRSGSGLNTSISTAPRGGLAPLSERRASVSGAGVSSNTGVGTDNGSNGIRGGLGAGLAGSASAPVLSSSPPRTTGTTQAAGRNHVASVPAGGTTELSHTTPVGPAVGGASVQPASATTAPTPTTETMDVEETKVRTARCDTNVR